MNTIPDDIEPVLNSTSSNSLTNNSSNNNPSSSSTSPSPSSSNSSSGWTSTRKIRSGADRVRFREKANEVLQNNTPKKAKKQSTKFKIGLVISSVAVGELLPLEEGQQQHQQIFNRQTIILHQPHYHNNFINLSMNQLIIPYHQPFIHINIRTILLSFQLPFSHKTNIILTTQIKMLPILI